MASGIRRRCLVGHDLGLLSAGIRRLCLVGLVQAAGVVRCVWVGDHAILHRCTLR